MAKKEKGTLSSPVKITVEKPKVKKRAPGNPGLLNKGTGRHSKKDANGCTDLEARFVQFYLVSWSKAEAVRLAGYDSTNPSSLGYELLQKPHIKLLVDQHKKEFADDMKEMKVRLAKSYAEVAFSDISDYIELVETIDKSGKKVITPQFKTTDALTKGAGKLIESIKIGRNMAVEIKLESKSDAKLQLARHIGFFEVDNNQQKSEAVQIYMPDNNRGDVYTPPTEDES